MIAYIRGTVTAVEEDTAVVETSGIGYLISLPLSDLEELTVGDEVKIHVYMAVREDAVQLFGFLTKDALNLFRLLIGVSGIGPKGALSVLSALTPDELRFAILSDDSATISKVPGIGKKTAQKLILELKDKFDLQDTFEQKLVMTSLEADLPEGLPESRREAVQALTALGYGQSEAAKAVGKAWEQAENAEQMSTEDILRAALKYLG